MEHGENFLNKLLHVQIVKKSLICHFLKYYFFDVKGFLTDDEHDMKHLGTGIIFLKMIIQV